MTYLKHKIHFESPAGRVYLEKPSSWVESGKQTNEAQSYMKKLQVLKKEIFEKLDTQLKASSYPRKDFEMKQYTIQSNDTIGAILKKIPTFAKNNDLFLYSLTYMNVNKNIDINTVKPGEKISVVNGVMKIGTRISVDLLPWPETAPPAPTQAPSRIVPFGPQLDEPAPAPKPYIKGTTTYPNED